MYTNNLDHLLNTTFNTLPLSSIGSMCLVDNGVFQQSKPSKEGYEAKFKVPGYEKNEIKVSLSNKHLNYYENGIKTILIEASNKEYGLTKYYTTMTSNIDEASISATLKNGILTVSAELDAKKTKSKLITIVED